MTKVYCSISKTVVFKNFVSKQGLNVEPLKVGMARMWSHQSYVAGLARCRSIAYATEDDLDKVQGWPRWRWILA
jgi:hypothetical protein